MVETEPQIEPQVDRRSERRAARRAQNRADILDAAELVFSREGIRDGSLRAIATESGFSTAGIYLFFENKQQLLAETLTRRGDELVYALRHVTEHDVAPLAQLHQVIDVTVAFFAERPDFRLLLRQMRGGTTITGPVLAEYAGDVDARFDAAMDILTGIVDRGQRVGEIRSGDARALAHMFSVLVNEYVLLDIASGSPEAPTLAANEFHALVDGALRRDQARPQHRSDRMAT